MSKFLEQLKEAQDVYEQTTLEYFGALDAYNACVLYFDHAMARAMAEAHETGKIDGKNEDYRKIQMDDIRREAIEKPGLVQNQHSAMVEAKSNKNKKRYRMMFAKMRLEDLRRFGVDEEYEPPF